MQPDDSQSWTKHDQRDRKPPMSLLPGEALWYAAEVFGHGAIKYGADNWRKCDEPRRYLDATLRHLACEQSQPGSRDASGLRHVDHAVASLLIYAALQEREDHEW